MKFLTFLSFDPAKAAEIAQIADKVAKTPGQKFLAQYVCQGIPFPGVTPNTMVTIALAEVETNEAMSAVHYPFELAGASAWSVPVLELPVEAAAQEEKKYRG
jgi:tagatose-1,6-bisphosphate aldolase non-catalytic subunit AgaZ/GatZ